MSGTEGLQGCEVFPDIRPSQSIVAGMFLDGMGVDGHLDLVHSGLELDEFDIGVVVSFHLGFQPPVSVLADLVHDEGEWCGIGCNALEEPGGNNVRGHIAGNGGESLELMGMDDVVGAAKSAMDKASAGDALNVLCQEFDAVRVYPEVDLDHEALKRIQSCYSKKMIICYSEDPDAPRSTAGVTFVINKTLIAPRNISTYRLCAGRVLTLKIEWLETETTTLLNVYAPDDRLAHLDFWKKVETQRRSCRLLCPNFMLGDFNVTEDPIDRSPPQLDDPSAIDALRETRHAWDIQDAWRLTHPNERAYTYRAHANGQQIKSCLDRICVTSQVIQQTFHWEITPAPIPMNHNLVTVKYALLDAPEIGKGHWTLPFHMTENKEFLDAIIKHGMTL